MTTTYALDEVLDMVRPELTGCGTTQMEATLLDTARDFCKYTRCWMVEVEGESIIAGVSDYDIEVPTTESYPVAIEYMESDGVEVKFKTLSWLDANVAGWRHKVADDFRYFTHLSPLQFTIACVPDRGGIIGGLSYRVALTPTWNATTLDRGVVDEWIDTLSDGTKSTLMLMAGKPWSNQARGAQLAATYRAARGAARIAINRSRGNAEETALRADLKFGGR